MATGRYTHSGLGVTISIKDNIPNISTGLVDAWKAGMKDAAAQALANTRDFTPMKTGELRNNIKTQFRSDSGALSISWMAKNSRGQHYAPYQEIFEYDHYTTPGTHSHFMEATVWEIASLWRPFVADAIQDLIKDNTV